MNTTVHIVRSTPHIYTLCTHTQFVNIIDPYEIFWFTVI